MSDQESRIVGPSTAARSSTDQATAVDSSATGEAAPTGDIVIDAALRDLTAADPLDLDAQIERAESLQRTLQGRLADLDE
ncbi:MAG: hypothetical protein WCA30_03700 [Dermatophilaceae bacterium]